MNKAKLTEMVLQYQELPDQYVEWFNEYCDQTVGECDACGATAPLSPGQTSSGEGDFCAWGCGE